MSTQTFDTKQKSSVPGQADIQKLYGLPVDTTIAFSNHKGIYKPRVERRQRKLLKKLTFLRPFLERGERILRVAAGCSPISFLEQLLTGVILYSLKRTLFVFTNRRILHIPCSLNLSYRGSISQILYADCRRLYLRFSTLVARYKSGRCEKFTCISRKSRRKIKAILKSIKPPSQTSLELERSHLCPKCSGPLIKNYYTCPHCSFKFKTKLAAAALSIIFPGGGYFYTRHPFLGVLEALMETVFMGFLVVITWAYFVQSFHGELARVSYGELARIGGLVGSLFDPRGLGRVIAVCAIAIIFEKLVTILYANKSLEEFIPKKRRVEPQLEDVQEYRDSAKEDHIDATGWRSR
jgi:hypothetical protein